MNSSPHGTATFANSTNHGVLPIHANMPASGLPFVAATFDR